MRSCAHCSEQLPESARFCPSCSTPVEPEPAARERKLVTILFADLVGSTELGGSLDPEHTRDLLDRFYDAMAAEIALGGGTIEKFIGDAVVAVFGAPAAQEDHAERALQVALWMQHRLQELFGERLALRIGVNTGEVVIGRPREGSSFATGDAVNVSARLEQAARPGQVLVGERTGAARRSRVRVQRTGHRRGQREAGRRRLPGARPDGCTATPARRPSLQHRIRRPHARAVVAGGTARARRGRRGARARHAHRRDRGWARRASSGSSECGSLMRRGSGLAAASRTVAA